MNLLTREEVLELSIPYSKKATGIYFLIHGDEIVYVGQAANIFSRMEQHTLKDFNRFLFLPADQDQLLDIEREYIIRFQPRYNKTYPKRRVVVEVGDHRSFKTQQAVRFYNDGMTAYGAAKKAGIALSTIYKAIKDQKSK